MKLLRKACLSVVSAALLAGTGYAQQTATSVVKLPNEIEFKGLPGASQRSVLFGDPTKAGVFVERVKFPPGQKSMPHYHPDEVRTVVVLSGTFYFGVGDEWDESKLKAYPAGTFYSEAPRTPHFAWAKDGEVIIQVTGVGPTGTVPIPPKK